MTLCDYRSTSNYDPVLLDCTKFENFSNSSDTSSSLFLNEKHLLLFNKHLHSRKQLYPFMVATKLQNLRVCITFILGSFAFIQACFNYD